MLKKNYRNLIVISLTTISLISLTPITAYAEWKKDNVGWWYTEGKSYATGWRYINKHWYYFDTADGYMLKNGLFPIENNIYYFNKDGAMQVGWVYIDYSFIHKGWHYFKADGSMVSNSIISGYYLNKNGTWFENSNPLTKDEASEKIKQYIRNKNESIPKIIEFYTEQGNCYTFHFYESEKDKDKENGWYHINKYTGEVHQIY